MSQDTLEIKALELLSQALDQPSAEREAWLRKACADDEALAARVLALLEADKSHVGVLRTGGAGEDSAEEALPERVGAYQITGLIGQGGMGAVYEGRRDTDDFDHHVAIKLVKPGALSDELIERFQHERRILATLNHPHIARLFDGGEAEDGSPYIVMEYVDGEPITDWAKARDLSVDDRLWLFADLCSAVRYAHQNLVIHRDITPSNVLVTAEGSVKLIDFGIARPQSDTTANEGEETTSGLSFTPGYAAPERASGGGANTLSDIYSLGRILEALLDPSKRDADLEAVVARATAAQPEARYPSVDGLIDDLRAYRSGYAVSARGGGMAYRLGKYVRRHRLGVGVGALAVAALVGAFAVTFVQYTRAEAALERANERFEQARSLSRTLVFDVYDGFAQVAGTLEPRRALADLVSTYVETLAEDTQAPANIRYDVGVLQARLADIYGGLGLANLGDTDASYALLLAAEEALQELTEADPSNTDALAELIMVRRSLSMQSLIYRLDTDAAGRFNDQVLSQSEAGAALGDENTQTLLRHFWSGRTDRLQILLERQDLDTALAEVREWRGELDEAMFERLGGGEEMAAYLAMQEAEILTELDRSAEAIVPLDYARTYRVARVTEAPENYYQLTQLMVVHSELSRANQATGDAELAVSEAERAVDLARQIAALDSEDAGGPEGLASVLQRLAAANLFADRFDAALSAAVEAVDLARGLDQQFPDDVYYDRILLQALLTQAEVQAADESAQSACDALVEAETILGTLNAAEATTETLDTAIMDRLSEVRSRAGCQA